MTRTMTLPRDNRLTPAPPLFDAGQTLNYISSGVGTPAILIHGLAASLHDWEALTLQLASYSYQALAVDLFGHGDSPKPDRPELYTISNVIRTFEDWIDSQPLESPLMLIGHSLGGYVSLKFAMRNPDKVSCLVLIDPFYSKSQLSPIIRFFTKRPKVGVKALQSIPITVIDSVLGWDPINIAQFPPEWRWQVAYNAKRASPNILEIPSTIEDLTDELSQIQTPILVIWGSKDLTLLPESFKELVNRLPNASGHEVAGCRHHPHIGKPVLVNRLILDFLELHRQSVRQHANSEIQWQHSAS